MLITAVSENLVMHNKKKKNSKMHHVTEMMDPEIANDYDI
jgi:hypothetical protein